MTFFEKLYDLFFFSLFHLESLLDTLSETSSFFTYFISFITPYTTNFTLQFTFKLVLCLSLLILIRGGVPRYRYDFLTKLGWVKFLGYLITTFVTLLIFFLIW